MITFFLRRLTFPLIAFLLFAAVLPAHGARQQISEDRDLKELDLTHWDCFSRLEGTAKTPDGAERNRLKNRPPIDVSGMNVKPFDTAGFLQYVTDFTAKTTNKRRKELIPVNKQQLEPLEKQIVQLTAYLGVAYCGPPESTNCGSGDFHDWHLEVFEKPIDHPPHPGDPTPIICEITPRTQNAIYRDGIRIQELAAFFRRPDLTYEPTGHPAQKIRLTGYLLWDDEHNGTSDVGTSIRMIAPNKYHQPWRSAAWEIHPVVKIERAEGANATAGANSATSAPSLSSTAAEQLPPPAPQPVVPSASEPPPIPTPPPPTATPQQFVTITQPVRIKIHYGETLLPRGAKLPVVARDAQTVTIKYMGQNYAIPASSTDLTFTP